MWHVHQVICPILQSILADYIVLNVSFVLNIKVYSQARRNVFEATGAEVINFKLQGQLQQTYGK